MAWEVAQPKPGFSWPRLRPVPWRKDSTQTRSYMDNQGTLVSNETIKGRSKIVENVERFARNMLVTTSLPRSAKVFF